MRPNRSWLVVGAIAAAVSFACSSADAGIWSLLGKAATKSASTGAKAGKLGVGLYALEDIAGLLARLPSVPKHAALGAHVSPEGHWTFLNKQSDTFTAAYPNEMERLNGALVPDMPADGKLSLYLTEESAFADANAIKSLPNEADLSVVMGRDSYALERTAEGSVTALRARIRPNLTVDLTSRQNFEEAVYLLGRPLNRSNVRLLAIEQGGPKQLSSVPAFNKADKTTLVDRIDPSAVSTSLAKVRGQTVLVTGRIDGDALHISSNSSDALSISKLREAAEAADVNLVILQQSSPRQPGARNWLWQKTEVDGLKDALQQTSYGDFFSALGASRGELSVTALPDGAGRTLLQVMPASTPGSSLTGDFVPWAGNKASEWFGNIGVHSVTAFLRESSRDKELDARVIPGIPSWIQILACMNMVIGLFSYQVSWPWWQAIWPPEVRGEYRSRLGYSLARVTRMLAYLFIFLPIFGGLAFLWLMALTLRDALHAPARWWRALRGWFGGGVRISQDRPS